VAGSAGKGVGASLKRKEDDRYLRGQGEFVADIQRPGMLEVAFVRSPIAHGRILSIQKPAGSEASVFTMEDLAGVKPIRAVSGLKGFKASNLWPLAKDKVRHVGESIAMCVARTRAEAEDLAAEVLIEYETLPAVVDMVTHRPLLARA
jgi:carbon-monoxide dehydrogenase large subunit